LARGQQVFGVELIIVLSERGVVTPDYSKGTFIAPSIGSRKTLRATVFGDSPIKEVQKHNV
jgi:hypothetical protein